MNATELEDHLQRYLAVRSALGYRDCRLRNLMQDFVRYVIAANEGGPIRARTAVNWACATAGQNGASRLAYRLSAARGVPHAPAGQHTGHGSSQSWSAQEVSAAHSLPFFERANCQSAKKGIGPGT